MLKSFKRDISSLVLIPSDGGCFEVKKNDQLVFSKLASKRFPADGEIKGILTGSKPAVTT